MDPKQASILAQDLGSGEIFLNSIDRDGSRKGYDLDLAKMVTESIKIPVILCGGVGSFSDFHQGVLNGGASAVAASNIFHHIEHSTILAKAHMAKNGISIRTDSVVNYLEREFDSQGRLTMLRSDILNDLELSKWETRIDGIL